MNFSGYDFDKNAVGVLSEADASNRFPHAIIIESENGEKAMELAVFLSMYTVCEAEEKPCGVCKQCKNAKARAHADIFFMEPTKDRKHYGIDQIREMTADAYIVPNEGRGKVYVLDKADERLDAVQQNALLKLAEEPPKSVRFILICKSAQAMLETIRSRFTVIRLNSGIELDPQALDLARKIAAGVTENSSYSLLKALSCLADKKQKERSAEVLQALRLILRDAVLILNGSNALADYDSAKALAGRITVKKLLQMQELCGDAELKLKQNVNINLLAAWLCGEFRRIIWQR